MTRYIDLRARSKVRIRYSSSRAVDIGHQFGATRSYLQRGILALLPDSWPEFEEHERDRKHRHTDEAEQTRCPTNAEALIHLEGEEREGYVRITSVQAP